MAIKASIYNSPDIGAAFSNIAQMFAPPSAQDAAAYSAARKNNQTSDIIQKLAGDPRYADFDHQAEIANLFAPTQSYYAQDQNNAMTARGQDIGAATSLQNNAADNTRAFDQTRFGPLNPGQMLPAVPGAIASQFALPEQPVVQGNPKPLTDAEMKAAILGTLPAAEQRSVALEGVPVQTVVTPEGPKLVPRSSAYGMEPAVKPAAAPTGYRWAQDGTLEFIPHGPADPATAGKTTQATRRNQQLASVITPELQSLLGDGTAGNPGTFDSLSNKADIARSNVPGAMAVGQGPSSNYQQAQNSLRTIVASYLYSVSGATANPNEIDTLVSVLTPKFGEDPKSVAGKKARLQQMVEAVQAAATGAPFEVPGSPGAAATASDTAAAPAAPAADTGVSPEGTVISNGQQTLVKRGGQWVPQRPST